MERFYSIAGSVIRVTGPDGQMDCDDSNLRPYECPAAQWDHWLEFSVVQKVSPPIGQLVYAEDSKRIYIHGDTHLRYEGTVSNAPTDAYIRIERQGKHSRVEAVSRFLAGYITAKLVLNAMEAEHMIALRQGVILHAAYIRWNEEAILFTAPSGTGKSTQAELWGRLRGAELVNGDRVAVMTGSDKIMACGIPFCGSSGVNENVTVPVRAVVYLSQGKNTEIHRLSGVQAFRRVWEGCSVNVWNREDMAICTQTVMEIVSRVPVFHLSCTPDESAVLALEQQILDNTGNV